MFKSLLNLIFPEICNACNDILLDSEEFICTSCRHELPISNWNNPADNLLTEKLKGRVLLVFTHALLYFEKGNVTQSLLHNLKYKNFRNISAYLGKWHAEYLQKFIEARGIDVIVPVPIHKSRKRKRGYNQVEDYAREISLALNSDYDDKILVRLKKSRTQVFKNRLSRIDVFKNNFAIKNTEKYKGKHIALVDDVITTGATAEACFIQLAKIDNVKLSLIVMAVA